MISVVIPTYNERKNISILIPQISDVLIMEDMKFEIIIVDDSSPDGTADLVKELSEKYNCRAIVKETREGVGAAHAVGYNNAKYDIILTMDADLSHSPQEISLLLKNLNKSADIVLASRHLESSFYEKKKVKTKIKSRVSSVGNALIKVCLKTDVHDYSNGFRCFKKEVWNSIKVEDKGNAFLLEFIVKAHKRGFKIVEVPTTFNDRQYGKSKLNLPKESINFLIKILYLSLRIR
jgi:dolichol-phosphate mannosyltransferase